MAKTTFYKRIQSRRPIFHLRHRNRIFFAKLEKITEGVIGKLQLGLVVVSGTTLPHPAVTRNGANPRGMNCLGPSVPDLPTRTDVVRGG